MSAPTIRAALQRLVELDSSSPMQDAQWAITHENAIADAIAALAAEPVGKGQSGEELLKTYCDARRAYYFQAAEGESDQEDRKAATIAGLQATLARWGHPAAPPAPEAGES